jgi:hypothetical protein
MGEGQSWARSSQQAIAFAPSLTYSIHPLTHLFVCREVAIALVPSVAKAL